MAIIREIYSVTVEEVASLEMTDPLFAATIECNLNYSERASRTSFPALPTRAEIDAIVRSTSSEGVLTSIRFATAPWDWAFFESCTAMVTAPAIPDYGNDVTVAANYMFKDCTALVNGPVMGSPIYNTYNFFIGCTSLQTANINASQTSISGMFSGCTALVTTPTIPEGVTDMSGAFTNCTSLTTITNIPSSVTDLSNTFYGCTSLSTAPTIPVNVTDISYTFKGCTSLTTPPTIPSGVEKMVGTFENCTQLTSAPEIPSNTYNISKCFSGCTALVTGPSKISENIIIMNSCFKNCSSLTGTIRCRTNATIEYVASSFSGTVQPITLKGINETELNMIADTAENENVTVVVLEFPTPVTNRMSELTRTTATDMTRIAKEAEYLGADLPKVTFTNADIVTEAEWNAIVNFAITLDEDITYSTIYTNLNDIESAFRDKYEEELE